MKNVIVFAFLLSFLSSLFAQIENNEILSSSPPVYSDATETIQELVRLSKTYKDINEKGITEEERIKRTEIKNKMSEILDIGEMARLILINHWSKLRQDEKEKYSKLLKRMVEEIGYPQIGEYFNKKIEINYKGEKELSENKKSVLTEIVYHEEDLILHTEFYVHKKNNKWSIYDVITDGDSLLLIYRNQHTKIIKEKGFNHLIQLMQKKLESKKEK